MNSLEISTYSEPSWDVVRDVIDEFSDSNKSEEEKEKCRQKTIEMYNNFTDDDFRHLGECF